MQCSLVSTLALSVSEDVTNFEAKQKPIQFVHSLAMLHGEQHSLPACTRICTAHRTEHIRLIAFTERIHDHCVPCTPRTPLHQAGGLQPRRTVHTAWLRLVA